MKRLALAVMVLLSGAGVAIGMWGFLRPEPPPPVEGYPAAPEFAVTAHDGSTLRNSDLRGRPWLAAFVFTRCTTICPIITSKLSELSRTLPPSPRIVAFSVDPDYDTTAVLAKHAAGLGAQVKRWAFAGFKDKAERDRVVKGFMLTAFDTPDDKVNAVAHDVHIALVDADGRVRGWYDSSDPEKMAALRHDATALSLTGFFGMPAVNATLNAVSAVLLASALAFIRAGRREPHVAYVLGALAASAGFLTCYLWYHAVAGSTNFPRSGTEKTLYLALLTTHTVLAAVVPFLIAVVLTKALKGEWERHKKWAHIAVPLWMFVSLSGVAIYWWLYRA